jgi:uncharacterized protein (DUF1501 family)
MINIISRRGFLEKSVQMAIGAAAGAYLGIPTFFRKAMAQGQIPDGTKKILFIFLRGGNDGLNTVIPWADTAYSAANRPSLYIPSPDLQSVASGRMPTNPDLTRVVDLGNGFAGVHPGLANFAPVYNAGQVAVIHRVGYPKQSRSHFDSQRYWENGTPRDNINGSGILYRAVVNTGLHQGRSFPGVSVQSGNPLMLRGDIAMTNLADPARYDMAGVMSNGTDKAKLLAAISAQHAIDHPEKDNRDLLFPTGAGLKSSIDALKSIGLSNNNFFDADGTTHLFPVDGASNQKGATFNASYGFFKSLKYASQILAHTDAVVAGTQLGGFDTHDNQGALTGGHAQRMAWIGWGIYAVRKFMMDTNPALWNNTVIITLSEFGRTTKENGNQGTDHAEAGPMFVAGGKVKGGVYECSNSSWPIGPTGAMFQVNSRYLRRSVDYRSVFGEIIRDHLGATPAQLETIIPGYADPNERLQTGGRVTSDGTTITGELGII